MTDLGSSEDPTWSVLILNDDDTPMEFVVAAIERFFDMQCISCSAFITKESPSAGLTRTK
jgi:ATP-dependent Clp protease adapter protein ClpS